MSKYIATANTQNRADGFTHKFIVTFDDFSVANAGTVSDSATHTLTHAVKQGEAIVGIAYRLITPFDDSGGGSDLTVAVGDGGDPDGLLASSQIHLDNTDPPTGFGTGAYIAAGGQHYPTGDDTVDYLFTPDASGTAYSVNELTQGEIHFYLKIIDVNERG
tara:strand:+ start:964 stop:1446 length:483 start_codon:yes stop_codon:yes gene_type:complete